MSGRSAAAAPKPLPTSSAALAEEEAAYRQHHAKVKPPSLALTFAAAGMGNSLSAICTNPADIVKVRQQLLTQRQRPSFARIGIDMARNEGITSLWNGVTASCLREASYSTIRMGSYELFKDLYSNVLPPTSFAVKLLSGITSGAIGSAIATPTDLLKVRMQAARPSGRPPYRNTFVGFVEVFREGARAPVSTAVPQAVARAVTQSGKAAAAISGTPVAAAVQEKLAGWQGGVRALYRGVGPNVLRAAVLTSSQIGTYDETKTFFKSSGLLSEGIGLHLAASTVAANLGLKGPRRPRLLAASSRSSPRSFRSPSRAFSSSSASSIPGAKRRIPKQLQGARAFLQRGDILRGMQIVIDHMSASQAASPPSLTADAMEPILLDICIFLDDEKAPNNGLARSIPKDLIDGPIWRPPQLGEEEDPSAMPLEQQCVAALATLFDLMTKNGMHPTARSLSVLLTTFTERLAPDVVAKAVDVAVAAKGSLDTETGSYDFDATRIDLALLCTIIVTFGRIGQCEKGERFLSIWARKRSGGQRHYPTVGEVRQLVEYRLGVVLPRSLLRLDDLMLVIWSGDVAIWNALIRSRVLQGDLEGARTWLELYRLLALQATREELQSAGRPPASSSPYLNLMEGFSNASLRLQHPATEEGSRRTRLESIKEILVLMAEDGVKPSSALANFIVAYQSGIGSTGDVSELLLDMLERGVIRSRVNDLLLLEPDTVGAIFRLQSSHYRETRGGSTSPYSDPDLVNSSSPKLRPILEICASPRALLSWLFVAQRQAAPRQAWNPHRRGRSAFMSTEMLNKALAAMMITRDFPAALVILRTFEKHRIQIDATTRAEVLLGWVRVGGLKQATKTRRALRRREARGSTRSETGPEGGAGGAEQRFSASAEVYQDRRGQVLASVARPSTYEALARRPDGGLRDLMSVVQRAILFECGRARSEAEAALRGDGQSGSSAEGSKVEGEAEEGDDAELEEGVEQAQSRRQAKPWPVTAWAARLEPKVREHMQSRDRLATLSIVMADAWKTILPGAHKEGGEGGG